MGISRRYDDQKYGGENDRERSARLQKTMTGTPMYMAPEVYREEAYNESVDCFALGCCIYDAMEGLTTRIDHLKKSKKPPIQILSSSWRPPFSKEFRVKHHRLSNLVE